MPEEWFKMVGKEDEEEEVLYFYQIIIVDIKFLKRRVEKYRTVAAGAIQSSPPIVMTKIKQESSSNTGLDWRNERINMP